MQHELDVIQVNNLSFYIHGMDASDIHFWRGWTMRQEYVLQIK